MSEEGFEALADGTLLLTVLLVASVLVVGWGRPLAADGRSAGIQYAEDTRRALFGTTLDGLSYRIGGEDVAMRNGTTVETFLRLEVHLLRLGPGWDFAAANARIAGLAAGIVRPGWAIAVLGGNESGPAVVRLPEGLRMPPDYFASGWTYPPLDGAGDGTRLQVLVWLSPHR